MARPRRPWLRPSPAADPAATPEVPEPPLPAAAREDDDLLRRARAGDLDAFNLLVLRHERAVFNVCLRILHDAPTAEDATQDTFIRAWGSLDGFRGDAVRPWLFKIATNRSFDLLRVRSRRATTSLDAEPFEIEPVWTAGGAADESPDAGALRKELGMQLERALAQLPEDQRTVVILADVQGLDYHEVAEATGAALGTVKSRLSRGRSRLRQILRDDAASSELFGRFTRLQGKRAEGGPPAGAPNPADGTDGN